jgi:hypothetical protein
MVSVVALPKRTFVTRVTYANALCQQPCVHIHSVFRDVGCVPLQRNFVVINQPTFKLITHSQLSVFTGEEI